MCYNKVVLEGLEIGFEKSLKKVLKTIDKLGKRSYNDSVLRIWKLGLKKN